MTLERIAESVARNGRWSHRAIRAGMRIWRKTDKAALDEYILGLGFKRDTEDFYGARHELRQQVEELCREMPCQDDTEVPF